MSLSMFVLPLEAATCIEIRMSVELSLNARALSAFYDSREYAEEWGCGQRTLYSLSSYRLQGRQEGVMTATLNISCM